jgi:outer membrane protein
MYFPRSNTTMKRFVTGAFAVLFWALVAVGAARAADTKTISLKNAIDAALKANVDLRQAATLTESREISVRRSKADFLPDLKLSLGASQSYGKQLDTLSNGFEWGRSSSMANLSVSSGLDLFSGFGRIAALRQSQLQLDSERKSFTWSREQVIYETVQQFVLVVLDGELTKADQQNLEAQNKQLAQIQAFTTAGRSPIVDLYQQQAAVADAESRLLVDQRNSVVDTYKLLQIMGVQPETGYTIVSPDVDEMTNGLVGLVGEDAVKKAFAGRTDLEAQRLQVEAARKQITVSRAGYWPSLSISAAAGTGYQSTGSYDFGDQFYTNNLNASVGVSLSVPIFDRLTTKSSVDQAKVQLRQAEIGVAKLELQVEVDVRQALEDYATASKAVEVAQAQSTYSEQALKSMEERYRVSASTLVDLTLARATSLQSTYNLINARYSRLLKGVAVLYYAGRIDDVLPLFY